MPQPTGFLLAAGREGGMLRVTTAPTERNLTGDHGHRPWGHRAPRAQRWLLATEPVEVVFVLSKVLVNTQ